VSLCIEWIAEHWKEEKKRVAFVERKCAGWMADMVVAEGKQCIVYEGCIYGIYVRMDV
jgi:hypothetical protein